MGAVEISSLRLRYDYDQSRLGVRIRVAVAENGNKDGDSGDRHWPLRQRIAELCVDFVLKRCSLNRNRNITPVGPLKPNVGEQYSAAFEPKLQE